MLTGGDTCRNEKESCNGNFAVLPADGCNGSRNPIRIIVIPVSLPIFYQKYVGREGIAYLVTTRKRGLDTVKKAELASVRLLRVMLSGLRCAVSDIDDRIEGVKLRAKKPRARQDKREVAA